MTIFDKMNPGFDFRSPQFGALPFDTQIINVWDIGLSRTKVKRRIKESAIDTTLIRELHKITCQMRRDAPTKDDDRFQAPANRANYGH